MCIFAILKTLDMNDVIYNTVISFSAGAVSTIAIFYFVGQKLISHFFERKLIKYQKKLEQDEIVFSSLHQERIKRISQLIRLFSIDFTEILNTIEYQLVDPFYEDETFKGLIDKNMKEHLNQAFQNHANLNSYIMESSFFLTDEVLSIVNDMFMLFAKQFKISQELMINKPSKEDYDKYKKKNQEFSKQYGIYVISLREEMKKVIEPQDDKK